MANLDCIRIIEEPIAAALCKGTHHFNFTEAKNYLFFDFGGGTLDLTILEIKQNHLKIKAIDGN